MRDGGSERLSDFPKASYLMSVTSVGIPTLGWLTPRLVFFPCLPVVSIPSKSAQGDSSSAIQSPLSHQEDFTAHPPEGPALAIRSLCGCDTNGDRAKC